MAKKRTSKDVQKEIDGMHQQIVDLRSQHEAILKQIGSNWTGDNSDNEQQLLKIDARQQGAAYRLADLETELKAVVRAEKIVEYEAGIKKRYEHYSQLKSLDEEIAGLGASMQDLKDKKRKLEEEFSDGGISYLMQELYRDDDGSFEALDVELTRKYSVEGYI